MLRVRAPSSAPLKRVENVSFSPFFQILKQYGKTAENYSDGLFLSMGGAVLFVAVSRFEQSLVESALFHERVVVAFFDYVSVLHDENYIGFLYRG